MSAGRRALLLLLGAGLTAAIYAFFIEPNRLVVERTRITLDGWPAGIRGLRVTVFSDLHAGAPFIGVEKIRRVVAEANATQPDLIVIPGDFVIHGVIGGHFIEPKRFAAELKQLQARYGVFATLGNHDVWYGGAEVAAALEAAGIRVLDNQSVRIDFGVGAIWLAGIADGWSHMADIGATLRQVTNDAPVIAMTHSPDIFPDIPARVALTIAGHTHGGQVALPIVGRPIVPSHFGQRYAIGHIVENGRHLFVTTGIGTSIIPVRFGVPPEIDLLTID